MKVPRFFSHWNSLLILFALPGFAIGQTRTWQGGTETWDGTDTAVWLEGAVPGAGSNVFLTQDTAADIAITFDAPGLTGAGAINNLRLENEGGGVTTFSIGTGEALDNTGLMNIYENTRLLIDGGTLTRIGADTANRLNLFGGTLEITGGAYNYGWDGVNAPTVANRATLESGSLIMTGGQFNVANHLEAGNTGTNLLITMSGGTLRNHTFDLNFGAGDITANISGTAAIVAARALYIGSRNSGPVASGTHVWNVSGGTISVIGTSGIVIGDVATTTTVNVSGGTFGSGNGTTVRGDAILNISGQSAQGPGQTYVNSGNTFITQGTVNQTGGYFRSGFEINVGNADGATGEYIFTAGIARSRGLLIGYVANGTGLLEIGQNAQLWTNPTVTAAQQIQIGATSGSGSGTLWLKGGQIVGGTDPFVSAPTALSRVNINETGVLRGYGNFTINSAQNLLMNGRVIADGEGVDRTLTVSGYSALNNSAGNTTDRGWYATNAGTLLLKDVSVAAGNTAVNWGDNPADSVVELVNSVRLSFTNVDALGTLTGSLLAVDQPDIPAYTFFGDVISVHDFQSTFSFDSLAMTVRYDDALVSDPNLLRMFHYTGGNWSEISSFTFDADLKHFTANDIGSFSYFALAVIPEPNTNLLFLAAGAAFLLLRRFAKGRKLVRVGVEG